MQRLTALALLAALCLPLTAAGPSPSLTPPQAEFAAAAPAWTDFDFFRERAIFVPTLVNGQPVQAMLDSGAGGSVLDAALAEKLGIKGDASVKVRGAGGMSTGKIGTGVDITVGGLRLKNVTVVIIDMSSLSAPLGRPLQMVLGREVFDAAMVDIDFPGRKIGFRDPATYNPPAGAASVALAPAEHGVRRFDISLEGGPPVAAQFDLGNLGAVALSSDYAGKTGLVAAHPSTDDLAGGVGGLSVHDELVLKSVRIGGVELHDVPAIVSRSDTEEPRQGANVGMEVMSRFRLITDYGHNRLLLSADPAVLAAPFVKDRSGLRTIFAGDRSKVMFVSKGSPAEAAGWKVGDEILAIDGEAIGPNILNDPPGKWTSRPAGEVLTFKMADGSTRRLTLRDYF